MLTFFYTLTLVLFIIVCLFMILLVLIQKGRGGGLASAFGGAGGNTAFGSKTGDVLTWATSVVFGIFLVLAVALNLLATEVHERTVGVTTPAAGAPAPVPAAQQQPEPVVPLSEASPPPPSPEPGLVNAETVENPNTPMAGEISPAPGAPAAPAATQPASTQPGANQPR